jgi:serine/threonine protein kinase
MTLIRTNDGFLECELSDCLGEGRDGICYRVANNNLGLHDMVLKIMKETRRAQEILHHIERLFTKATKRSFCTVQSLECLLVTPLISEDHKCCLLMPMASGTTLTDEESLNAIMSLSMRNRVYIAYQIALGVKSVHESGLIHADIAGPNIVIDTKDLRAFVIDIDGGGIVDSLAPRIKGHHGDWMAPELQPEDSPPPDQSSDCWSLAVVLHEVITGLSPFYFCPTIQDITEYNSQWPPQPSEVGAEHRQWAVWHRQVLEQIGEVQKLFTRTFNSGRMHPRVRPTALEWEQFLLKHLGKLPGSGKRCPKCSEENSPELIYCRNEGCETIIHRSLYRCSRCNHFVPINALFCPECGAKQ